MQETENSILEDIHELGDVLLSSEFLIRCGKVFAGMSDEEKNDNYLIKNCQTKTWVRLERSEGSPSRLVIKADSLSMLVKGALSFICEIYDSRTACEISSFRSGLLADPEFSAMFSQNELKGLGSIIDMICQFRL